MPTYTAEQIYAFAREAGFSPDEAVTMTAIALAESGGRSQALNASGEDSRGLWQINMDAHRGWVNERGLDLYDPRDNAVAAFEVSRGGRDISPWTVTHGGKDARYLAYRYQAESAAAASGEPAPGLGVWTGTSGYGDQVSARDGVDDTSYVREDGDEVVGVVEPTTFDDDTDSDTDGLSDALEEVLSTDATRADSDDDDMSDSYELFVSGTDPTRVDSDRDGIADSVELALGYDPLDPDEDRDGRLDSAAARGEAHVDSDADRLSDELEEVLGTDPTRADSDGEGVLDGLEHIYDSDPLDPAVTPLTLLGDDAADADGPASVLPAPADDDDG